MSKIYWGLQDPDRTNLALDPFAKDPADDADYSYHPPSSPAPSSQTSDPVAQSVSRVGGKIVINGQTFSLSEALLFLFEESANASQDGLVTWMSEVEDKNTVSKGCTTWTEKLRALRPSDSDGTVKASDLEKARNTFKSQFGYDPVHRYGIGDMWKTSGDLKQQDVDQMLEALKSAQSDLGSDIQMGQIHINRGIHTYEQCEEAASNAEKSIHDTLSGVISKI